MPAFGKELFDIQATIECRFTVKRVRDIIITYSRRPNSPQRFFFIPQETSRNLLFPNVSMDIKLYKHWPKMGWQILIFPKPVKETKKILETGEKNILGPKLALVATLIFWTKTGISCYFNFLPIEVLCLWYWTTWGNTVHCQTKISLTYRIGASWYWGF